MLNELHASHTEYTTDDDTGFYMFPAVIDGDLQKHKVAHIGVMGKAEARRMAGRGGIWTAGRRTKRACVPAI